MAALVCACGPSKVPRLANGHDVPDSEEVPLREKGDAAEKAARDGGIVIEDPVAQPWLDSVTARLLLQFDATGLPVRVAVIRDPKLNAGSLDNGLVYVSSGLLARLENEAQLAGVLGHELEHYLGRHALRKQRTADRSNGLAGAAVVLSPVPFVGLGVLIAAMASDGGGQDQDQELERESDRAALRAMAGAGYDPGQLQRAFEVLQSVSDEAGVREEYKYGSRQVAAERIASCREQAADLRKSGQIGEGGRTGTEEYVEATADVMLVNAQLDLEISRFYRAQKAVDRYLAVRPKSANGHLLKGQILRQAAGRDRGLLLSAVLSFERAAALDPNLADARRELGLAQLDLDQITEARVNLAEYLRLAPQAADRAIVESYL